MSAEAITEARRAQQLSGAQTVSTAYEGYALAKERKMPEARATLDALIKLPIVVTSVALIYNALGEKDEAVAGLQRGLDAHHAKIAFLKVDL